MSTVQTSFRLTDRNTRFALPIVDPFTGDVVSAETLYNRACDDMSDVITDHIGDLILDNLDYSAGPRDDAALCATVYAWANSVHKQLAAEQSAPTISTPQTSQQATGRYSDVTFGRDDNYPWRAVVRGMSHTGQWVTLEVFEWSNEAGAHAVAADAMADHALGWEATHYYVGEVA